MSLEKSSLSGCKQRSEPGVGMQRARVPCHSECAFTRHCAQLLIYMTLLSLQHAACISFLGTETVFTFIFMLFLCSIKHILISCPGSQSLRGSLAIQRSLTKTLFTNKMPKIRKERLCHHQLNRKLVLPLRELLTVKKGYLMTLGSEPFFQLLANSLGSKLPMEHVKNPFHLHKGEFFMFLSK